MKKLLLIPLLLSACVTPSNYTTRHGIEVYCQDSYDCFTQYEVEEITDVFIYQTPDPAKIKKALKDYVTYLDIVENEDSDGDGNLDGFDCSVSTKGKHKRCAGLYESYMNKMTIAFMECSADSSLAHELAHLMIFVVYREYTSHADTRFFTDNCPAKEEDVIGYTECAGKAVVPLVKSLTGMLLCGQEE